MDKASAIGVWRRPIVSKVPAAAAITTTASEDSLAVVHSKPDSASSSIATRKRKAIVNVKDYDEDDEDDDDPRRNTRETRAYVQKMRNQGAANNLIEIDMEESDDDNKEVRFGRKGEAMDCDVLTLLVLTDTLSCDSFSAVLDGSREASCGYQDAGCACREACSSQGYFVRERRRSTRPRNGAPLLLLYRRI